MCDAQDVDVLAQRHETTSRKPLLIAVPIAVAVVIVDQLTKRWALGALESGSCTVPDNCIDLFAGIKFHLVFNTGAAFTRGSGLGPLLAVVAFFMAGFLLYLATRRTDRIGVALFGVIAGGAVGNLLDRIFRADDGPLSGAVVDFIDLGWWPVFNIADSAIVVGVIAVILLTLFEPDQSAETTDDADGEPVGAGDPEEPDDAEEADDPEAELTADQRVDRVE